MAITWTAWDGRAVTGIGGFAPLPAELSTPNADTTTLRQLVEASLFSDARAADDEDLRGDTDRRGWWADFYSEGDVFGAEIWLRLGKLTTQNLRSCEEAARAALRWLVDDGIASVVSVAVERLDRSSAGVQIEITSPDGVTERWEYRGLWESIEWHS
jgi:phage gp46-like protein